MRKSADIERMGTRTYRYSLTRDASDGAPKALTYFVIGCNPSVANADVDDPTMTREISLLRIREDRAVLVKLNLWPLVATKLTRQIAHEEISQNRPTLGRRARAQVFAALEVARLAPDKAIVVAAWGALGAKMFPDEATDIVNLADSIGVPLRCWGRTKDGHPKHPLYLPASTQLERFAP